MLKNKLKVLLGFVLIVTISVLAQNPSASAKSSASPSINSAELRDSSGNGLKSLNFPKADEKNNSDILSPSACVQSPANLVSWYRAENNANDSIGANHGSFLGGSFTAGKVGQSFNITATQVVGVPDNAPLDFANAFTIEMWVNPSAAGGSDGRTLFISKGNLNFVNTQSYGIIFGADRRVGNRVGNGAIADQATSVSQLPLNTFTHIATTYDGTTLRVYVTAF